MTDRKYKFSWNLLGDIENCRPNLGPNLRIEVYRLLQFTFRDIMEKRHGKEDTDQIFYEAGKLAGSEFYKHVFNNVSGFNMFVKDLQKELRKMGIGILRIEEADIDNGIFVLNISEDLDCSGLPESGYEICIYDEGFIAGLFEGFMGKEFNVKEIDCWCTGDRTCRFKAEIIK
ncbi:MAG: V4R domain-containing protein [Clostridiales bacterium]